MKKLLIAVGLIIVLAGVGITFFLNTTPAPLVAADSPTATIIAQADSPASNTPTPQPTVTPIPPPSATPLPTHTPSPTNTPVSQVKPAMVVTPQPAETEPTPTTNYSGQWDFNFGTMTLSQNVSSLTGEYQSYHSDFRGRITGYLLLETNQFNGLWISHHDPVSQGFLRWRFFPHQGFRGSYDIHNLSGPWCGVRAGNPLPEGCGFSGHWQVRFGAPGDVLGQARLTQTGDSVVGYYTAEDGRRGEIVESTMRLESMTEAIVTGQWRDDSGASGPFEWRLNLTTGQAFAGYRLHDNSEWCGWRNGAARPSPCGY